MMWALSVIAVCSFACFGFAQSSCPGNTQQRIIECSQHLQMFAQATSPQEQQQRCGEARRGLQCIRQVVQACPGIEATQLGPMVSGFQQMEGHLNAICSPPVPPTNAPQPSTNAPVSNTANTCSRRDQRRLQRCSRRMQRYALESPIRCSKMERALDCVTSLLERCSSIIEGGILARVNSLREDFMEICVETIEPVDETVEVDEDNDVNNGNEVPEESACPSDYETNLMKCVKDLDQPMRLVAQGSESSSEACQEIYRNLDCVTRIVSVCGDQPAVESMSSHFNMDEIRSLIEGYCPASGTETDGGSEVEGPSVGTEPDTGSEGEEAGDCPAGHTRMLMQCMEPMQNMGPGSSQNMGEMCSKMNTGLNCIQDIADRCPNKPDVAALIDTLNLDHIRSIISAQCAGGPMPTPQSPGQPSGNCPVGYSERMMQCVEPMKQLSSTATQNMAEACRMFEEGFACLDNIVINCGGKPEVQALLGMLNIDEMKTMINSQCSMVPSNSCGVPDPEAELQRCNTFLSSFQRGGGELGARCRTLYEGFDCFRDLITGCPEDTAVIAFTSLIDIEETRESMSAYCPVKK